MQAAVEQLQSDRVAKMARATVAAAATQPLALIACHAASMAVPVAKKQTTSQVVHKQSAFSWSVKQLVELLGSLCCKPSWI